MLALIPIDHTNWRIPRVTLRYVGGNDAAPRLYGKLGFTHDPLPEDAEEDDEICMPLML